MLPFGEATSPEATTVPAGIGTMVGAGKAALTGPGARRLMDLELLTKRRFFLSGKADSHSDHFVVLGGISFKPTHSRWNHSLSHVSESHPTISP